MKENVKKVFISYAREDEDIAKKLYSDLKKEGINAWLDIEKLPPGGRWGREIKQAIENSDYFITLLSKNNPQTLSNWRH